MVVMVVKSCIVLEETCLKNKEVELIELVQMNIYQSNTT